jgi:hypothetical protein
VALHHVNGERHDNRLENLRLLCPNCHSQTDNFAGRKNGAAEVADVQPLGKLKPDFRLRSLASHEQPPHPAAQATDWRAQSR